MIYLLVNPVLALANAKRFKNYFYLFPGMHFPGNSYSSDFNTFFKQKTGIPGFYPK
jgi:hypothetical protein